MNKKQIPQILMIYKQTWLKIADNTNVVWLQVFHLYKGFKRKSTSVGFFTKGSAKVVEPPRIEYKGFKFKFNKKGDVCRSFIIRVRDELRRKDGGIISLPSNNCILIKKKQDLKSKYLYGPIVKQVRRKRFISLFNTVI